LLRDLIETTSEIGQKAKDPEQNVAELLNEAQNKILSLSSSISSEKSTLLKDVFVKLFKTWEKRTEKPDELPGIPTGWIDLDKFTGGLFPSSLIVVAARPKMGKTAFAMNLVQYVNTKPNLKGATLIVSLEMTKEAMAARLLTSEAKVDNKHTRFGNLESDDWDKLAQAVNTLSDKPIYINKSARTINQIMAEARRLNALEKDGLGLLVVDYLQLMYSDKRNINREQEIAEISRGLKAIAMDLDIPVIALSQLNRDLEKRSDKRPQMSDIRESGAIEQDADIILFIYRDEVYNDNSPDRGVAEIIIGANREGPTGLVRLAFVGKYTKFCNLSHMSQPPREAKNNPDHWNNK
jgi:replicative DNA helicase